MASWIDDELAGSKFADVRLEKRFRTLVEQLSEGIGETIPMACQDWANTKAAYRFLSNKRVSENDILRVTFSRRGRDFELRTDWHLCFTTRQSFPLSGNSRS